MKDLILTDIDTIVQQLEDNKLVELFNIDEILVIVIDEINKETQVPKVLIRYLLKTLIFISKKGSSKIAEKAKEKIFKYISKNEKILKLFSFINEELTQKLSNNEVLEYIELNSAIPNNLNNAEPINKILYSIFQKQEELITNITTDILKTKDILEHLEMLNTPNLEIKTITSTKGFDKLKYISNFSPFYGRKREVKILNDFCENEKNFLWFIIEGNAGQGKSRLAKEFCKQLPVYWEKGFIYADSFNDLKGWNPKLNTFIVIDDYKEKIKEVKSFLDKLSQKSDSFYTKVRVLLLNRKVNKEENNEELLNGDYNNLIDFQFKESYQLKELHNNDILNIIKKYNPENILNTRNNRKEIEKKILKEFEKFDKNKRAIFAAIFGIILSDDTLTKDISIHNYLKSIYQKENFNLDEKHLNLIVICIIKRKLKIENFNTDFFPSLEEIDEKKLSKLISINTQHTIYESIEPDIIAEAFLLEFLKPNNFLIERVGTESTIKNKLENFFDYCWLNFTENMFFIISRCLTSFPQDKSLDQLFNIDKLNLILNILKKKDNKKEYILFLKFASNYLIHLINYEKNHETIQVFHLALIVILEKLNDDELYEYAGNIGLCYIAIEHLLPKKDQQLTSAQIGCASFLVHCMHKSGGSPLILISFIKWFQAYAKEYSDVLVHKNMENYYSTIDKLPLSPENWKKLEKLIRDEISNLRVIAEKDNPNLQENNDLIDFSYITNKVNN